MNIFGGTSKSKLSETYFIKAGLINILIKITQVQNHLDFSFCLVFSISIINSLVYETFFVHSSILNLSNHFMLLISFYLFFKFNDDFSSWRWFIYACKFFYIRFDIGEQLDMLQLPLLRLLQHCEIPPKCEIHSEMWNLANYILFADL